MESHNEKNSIAAFVRRQKWLIFLLQQGGVFLLSIGFLMSVKMLTGKDIRGGKDAMGAFEFFGMVTLFTLIILLSVAFYRFAEGKSAPKLGIKPTPKGLLQLFAATIIAFLISAGTSLIGLATGSMQIIDTIGSHFDMLGVLLMVGIGLFSLTYNSVMEEISSRAVPLMLFRRHSIIFRVFVPALFFAAMHLAAEPFSLGAFYNHIVAGAVFAAAYLLTKNIWLASGIHTGTNLGVLFNSGRWQMGAFIKTEGAPVGPEWFDMLILTLVLLLGIWLIYRRKNALNEKEAEFEAPNLPELATNSSAA